VFCLGGLGFWLFFLFWGGGGWGGGGGWVFFVVLGFFFVWGVFGVFVVFGGLILGGVFLGWFFLFFFWGVVWFVVVIGFVGVGGGGGGGVGLFFLGGGVFVGYCGFVLCVVLGGWGGFFGFFLGVFFCWVVGGGGFLGGFFWGLVVLEGGGGLGGVLGVLCQLGVFLFVWLWGFGGCGDTVGVWVLGGGGGGGGVFCGGGGLLGVLEVAVAGVVCLLCVLVVGWAWVWFGCGGEGLVFGGCLCCLRGGGVFFSGSLVVGVFSQLREGMLHAASLVYEGLAFPLTLKGKLTEVERPKGSASGSSFAILYSKTSSEERRHQRRQRSKPASKGRS